MNNVSEHYSPPEGRAMIFVFYKLPLQLLYDGELLYKLAAEVLLADGFTIEGEDKYGRIIISYSDGSGTAIFPLSESHFILTPYRRSDGTGTLVVDFYTCRGPNDGDNVKDEFRHKMESHGAPKECFSVQVDKIIPLDWELIQQG